jgi:hypothetical protein
MSSEVQTTPRGGPPFIADGSQALHCAHDDQAFLHRLQSRGAHSADYVRRSAFGVTWVPERRFTAACAATL